ncbi:O-methyltransferase [Bacteroidota bacterium]
MLDYKFYFGYLKYLMFSWHKYGYGIHSPFVYDLIKNVMNSRMPNKQTLEIENIRKKLISSNLVVETEDYGALTEKCHYKKKKISSIVKDTAIKKKYGRLLYKMIARYKPANILELGTSLGFSTMYMAMANSESKVYTIEGCPNTLNFAKNNFKELNLNNIIASNGKFDEILSDLIKEVGKLDLVFFDGNHKKEPSLDYFNKCLSFADDKSIFIFDDINWSAEMREAWEEIKSNEAISLTIDLYFMGLVFFMKDFRRQDFIIRF